MKKVWVVLLVVGLGGLLLLVAIVGAGSYWWSRHKQELLTAGQQTIAEGRTFGAQTDNAGCVAEAVTRTRREQGLTVAIKHNLFLRACLEASRPTPGFCAAVPGRTEFIKGAQWQLEKCRAAGLQGDNYCGQLFQQVQQFCEARTTNTP